MNNEAIDVERLIDITVQYILANSLNADELIQSPRQTSSHFAKICVLVFGSYNFSKTFRILTMWKRNVKGL